jgi:hypothetical protein
MINFNVVSVEEGPLRQIAGPGVTYNPDGTVTDSSIYVYEYNDLYVSNDASGRSYELEDLNISHPCVLINMHDIQYFHFINDAIGSFLLMSKIIPNLKIVLINDQEMDANITNFLDIIPQDFAKTILGWLNDDGLIHEVINTGKHEKILFDKVFVLSSAYDKKTFVEKNSYSESEFYLTSARGNVSGSSSVFYMSLAAPFIRNYITAKALKSNRLPSDFQYPPKIFFSPGESMSRFWEWKRQIDFLINDGVVIDEDGAIESDPNGSFYKLANTENNKYTVYVPQWGELDKNIIRGKVSDLKQRYVSEKDLLKLEAFFLSRGYFIADSRNYAWIDLVNISMRAETIAVYAGAASMYAMMANSDTQVVYINPNTNYTFGHADLLSCFLKDPGVLRVFNEVQDPNTNFGIDALIQELAEKYADRL